MLEEYSLIAGGWKHDQKCHYFDSATKAEFARQITLNIEGLRVTLGVSTPIIQKIEDAAADHLASEDWACDNEKARDAAVHAAVKARTLNIQLAQIDASTIPNEQKDRMRQALSKMPYAQHYLFVQSAWMMESRCLLLPGAAQAQLAMDTATMRQALESQAAMKRQDLRIIDAMAAESANEQRYSCKASQTHDAVQSASAIAATYRSGIPGAKQSKTSE